MSFGTSFILFRIDQAKGTQKPPAYELQWIPPLTPMNDNAHTFFREYRANSIVGNIGSSRRTRLQTKQTLASAAVCVVSTGRRHRGPVHNRSTVGICIVHPCVVSTTPVSSMVQGGSADIWIEQSPQVKPSNLFGDVDECHCDVEVCRGTWSLTCLPVQCGSPIGIAMDMAQLHL